MSSVSVAEVRRFAPDGHIRSFPHFSHKRPNSLSMVQLAFSVLLKSSSVAVPFRHLLPSSQICPRLQTLARVCADRHETRPWHCAIGDIANCCKRRTVSSGIQNMFKLIATMRRGSATGLSAAWARYPTIEAARLGTAALLQDDRILRVMIVRNEVPPAFVEWAER